MLAIDSLFRVVARKHLDTLLGAVLPSLSMLLYSNMRRRGYAPRESDKK